MAIRITNHSNEPFSMHLEALREYARRAISEWEALSVEEEIERDLLFERLAELGGSCRMSEREMVSLVLRGVFSDVPPCWCSQCRDSYLKEH